MRRAHSNTLFIKAINVPVPHSFGASSKAGSDAPTESLMRSAFLYGRALPEHKAQKWRQAPASKFLDVSENLDKKR